MASSSGTSSGLLLPAGGGGVTEQRKRKRMLSNRESARRSRQRKQKHLDELTEQAGRLREVNAQIEAALTVTAQHFLGVEAENSVLRTRAAELGSRLQSLNEILSCMNSAGGAEDDEIVMMMRPWNFMGQQPPIMDMYQYC